MAINNFSKLINSNINKILKNTVRGDYSLRKNYESVARPTSSEINLFDDGVDILLGQDKTFASQLKQRNLVTLTPNASILIKKKAFSTFKFNNDLQWLDKTEKVLLRATKALFAYKVAQIRSYESLTKLEKSLEDSAEVNLSLLVDLYHNSQFLSIQPDAQTLENADLWKKLGKFLSYNIQEVGFEAYKQDILLLLERNAFASDLQLTTWVVDPNDTDNYGTGPGTGVIELGNFTNFSTSCGLTFQTSSGSFSLQDPYRIMHITEGDIEIAIEEAITGTVGLLKYLSDPSSPPVDTRLVVSAGLELLGLGGLDSTVDIHYIRDRLRVFYLGKSFINPGDGVHFYIRGKKTVQDFNKNQESFDLGFSSIDEIVLDAERILFTNGKIDLDTYKKLRQFCDNSFGMRHVYGGFIERSTEAWSNGRWTLEVSCVDNMGWLRWSRFMEQPALQDPQGILEDPLTPYEIKTDALGTVLSAGGPQLLEENKKLISNGLLFYDSGILNGQVATEKNLLQGQYNSSGSLSGTKIFQHPNGLVYRWKQGIITATAGVNLVDPFYENQITQKLLAQTYGLNVAQDVLNNLDIANILSLLIVGQPYNVETFITQAYNAHNISEQTGALNPTDPLSAVLDVVRRQNNHFGNFRPYRMITLSNQTLLQTANNSILRNEVNEKIRQLQKRRIELDILLQKLEKNDYQNNLITKSLTFERESIQIGIREQINKLKDSGATNFRDLLTQNFNLFGRSKTLPLTGNYSADHQLTRAMTLIGAQRRIEDVRLNRDKNLFIVSDQYDEQSDIRPFIFKLRESGFKLFKGNFTSIYEKCTKAADIVNLEFFCNTQGHLEFRPPQWNKTPLTVLERLFEINKQTNRKVVPEFLTEVFQTRSSSLRREIHSLNIRIVILCLLLNRYPDKGLIPNFNPSASIYLIPEESASNTISSESRLGKASLKFFGVETRDSAAVKLRTRNFNFGIGNNIQTGNQLIGEGLNISGGLGHEGDVLLGDTETILGEFDPVFQENTNVTQSVLSVAIQPSNINPIKIANASNINNLRESFVKLSGIDPASDLVTDNGKFKDSDFILNNESSETDNVTKASNYLNKLQETISNRDNLVTILKRNTEKQRELDEVEDIVSSEILGSQNYLKIFANENKRLSDSTNYQESDLYKKGYQVDTNQEYILTSISPVTWELSLESNATFKRLDYITDILDRAKNTTKTITDIFTGDANSGTLFDHLIADDKRNLLGPGSGKRHIIYDHDIKSCSFREDPPDYCRVDVVGDSPITGAALSNAFNDTYFWAGATDFDLCRQYGYKCGPNRGAPFINDAETQSRPYALFLLQLQRLKINTGTIQLVGNEYYEPGDVVYVASKQLIYYVRQVSHSYSQGDSFSTTLTLEFGHPPGTYLPSPLDVIGQQYVKDPLVGTNLTYRNSQGDDSYRVLQPDSALVFPDRLDITEDNINLLLSHKNNALRFVNIMAELSTILIGNRLVLLRGFVKDNSQEDLERVKNNLEIFKKLLQNPVSLTQENPTYVADDLLDQGINILNKMGAQIGNNKSTTPLTLPNGLPVAAVPINKIVEQIVFLDKDRTSSEFRCLNPEIVTSQTINGKKVDSSDYDAIFPKGGPKQRTWLDIRSGEFSYTLNPNKINVSNIIEIGLLDIERALKETVKQ
jgi:hypothetical protein